MLIAGLVRESDQFDKSGPGFSAPLFPTSRAATVSNTELVFLLKPRVIVYTSEDGKDHMRQSVIRDASGTSGQLDSGKPVVFPTTSIPADMLNPAGQ